MNILLVEDEGEARNIIQLVIEQKLSTPEKTITIVHRRLLQDAIELLEKQDQLFDLIVFAYAGTGQALVKCLIQYGGPTAYVMCAPDNTSRAAFEQPGMLFEVAIRSNIGPTLLAALDRLAAKRKFGDQGTPDGDFVPIQTEALIGVSPLKCDVYIKLGPERYIKLIKKGDELDAEDLRKIRDVKKAESLFLRKDEASSLLDRQADAVKKLSESPNLTEAEADKAASASIEALRDVVDRMGFTPQAQKLAKTSVEITLKLLGARPKLSAVLARLKQEEGKYITAHSLTLGKIACALAYKMQWNSAATYLKLTLASFLHDLPLKDNELAAYTSLEEAKKSGQFSDADLQAFKLHPIKSAEYTRQFDEIPADVDQILMQHHERPDGSGFPRSLTHKYISPLASLFIIAHDLMHYMSEQPPGTLMDQFFVEAEDRYQTGHFKKIIKQLKEDQSTAT
ncbi:MAG: hypothetical protein HY074_16075 [Deltaproteobacteria bacterium]|nr:hypothetical protein [Deltaproteobacteria bacterium]